MRHEKEPGGSQRINILSPQLFLNRYCHFLTIYSTKGDETLLLGDLLLKPGESHVIGSRNAKVPADQIWDEEHVWSNKKRDVGLLYDPWGRPVACADNGIQE